VAVLNTAHTEAAVIPPEGEAAIPAVVSITEVLRGRAEALAARRTVQAEEAVLEEGQQAVPVRAFHALVPALAPEGEPRAVLPRRGIHVPHAVMGK